MTNCLRGEEVGFRYFGRRKLTMKELCTLDTGGNHNASYAVLVWNDRIVFSVLFHGYGDLKICISGRTPKRYEKGLFIFYKTNWN